MSIEKFMNSQPKNIVIEIFGEFEFTALFRLSFLARACLSQLKTQFLYGKQGVTKKKAMRGKGGKFKFSRKWSLVLKAYALVVLIKKPLHLLLK